MSLETFDTNTESSRHVFTEPLLLPARSAIFFGVSPVGLSGNFCRALALVIERPMLTLEIDVRGRAHFGESSVERQIRAPV